MSQAVVVTWLAVRELWITFRLVILLLALVAVGAVVALAPAALPVTMQRLAIGLGAATLVIAAVAAWSVAEDRQQGRAGWLVTRSVPRGTLLGGWFVALSAVALAGMIATGVLGWLTASGVSLRLEPIAYAVRVGAVAATVVAVVALGVLAGTVARPRVAALLALLVAAGAGLIAWLVPDPSVSGPGRGVRRARRTGRRDGVRCRCMAERGRGAAHGGHPSRARSAGRGARRPVTAAEPAPEPIRMHPVAAWSALVVASLGVLLGGAELMVVAIALPSIVADFGGWADLGRVSWIVNAYLLAYVVAMPLAGRGADLWGARRLYVVALLLFIIGSAGAGLSRMAGPENGLAWLIGCARGAGLRRRRAGAAVDGPRQPPVPRAPALRGSRSRGRGHLYRHGHRTGVRRLGAAELQRADPRARTCPAGSGSSC